MYFIKGCFVLFPLGVLVPKWSARTSLHRSIEQVLRKQMREPLHLIDSTSFRLSHLSADWARFSANACGVKLHVVYDPDADCPLYAALSGPKINDITAAKEMPIDPMATYVFDLGYYDYSWWAKLDAAGCRIVTRLKTTTKLSNVIENAVPEGPKRAGA